MGERFDDRYYRRFYGKGGAHDREQVEHLATGVHHLAAWWGVRVRSVLDVGAGMGFWRDWYREQHPEVKVRSIDVSEYACATWGHERRDIADWRPPRQFDLVVCHSVLQYLDDERVVRAIDHLVGATRHLLYLELPTRDDLRHLVDRSATDMVAPPHRQVVPVAPRARTASGGRRAVGAPHRHPDVRARSGRPLAPVRRTRRARRRRAARRCCSGTSPRGGSCRRWR